MKFCIYCGAKMEDDDVFCQTCGQKAVMTEEQPAAPQPQETAWQPAQEQSQESAWQSAPEPQQQAQEPVQDFWSMEDSTPQPEPRQEEPAENPAYAENTAPAADAFAFSWDPLPESSGGFSWDPLPEPELSEDRSAEPEPAAEERPVDRPAQEPAENFSRQPETPQEQTVNRPQEPAPRETQDRIPLTSPSGEFSWDPQPQNGPQAEDYNRNAQPQGNAPANAFNWNMQPQGNSPAGNFSWGGQPQGGAAQSGWGAGAVLPPKKKPKTALIVIIIVAAVLLLAAGGVFLYLKLNDMELRDLFARAEEVTEETEAAGEEDSGSGRQTSGSDTTAEDFVDAWSWNGSQRIYYEIETEKSGAVKVRYHFNRTGYIPYFTLEGDGTGTFSDGVLTVSMYYTYYKEDERGNATQMGFGPFEETWVMAADLPENYQLSDTEWLVSNTGYPAPDWPECRKSKDYAVHQMKEQPELLDEYVLWFSSDVFVSEEDISRLTDREMSYALNEIYARHGRMFDSADLQDHFDGCSWYSGTVAYDAFDEGCLNEFERENLLLLGRHAKAVSVNGGGGQLPIASGECADRVAEIDRATDVSARPNMAAVFTGDTELDPVMKKNGVAEYEIHYYFDNDFNLIKAEVTIDESRFEYYYYNVGSEYWLIAQNGPDGLSIDPGSDEMKDSITDRGYKLAQMFK